MECNCNNNNNGGVIPWVRGNRLPLCICIYQMNVDQGTVSTMAYNTMTRTPYVIQADDTVTVTMKSGFRSVEMPFTTDGNKVLVIDNGELPTGTYTVEVTIERGSGERGRWQESRQVRIYENTDEAILGEMYSIEADLFFWAKGDTGVGIANITSNPDDTLTITMTDGTTYTTQAIKGDKGDKGDRGEKGTSIVSFDVTGQTDTSVIYTVTFSDDTTEEVAVPKGPQGDTGLTGNGISSTTLNSDYTLTIAYTDGTTYTTPSIRGAQGVQGVSIIAFTQTGETATNTLYNVVFSDGRTQSVAIPKGLKGDKGDTGNTGSQGAQGPKGDTVIIGDEQTYTLYNVTGQNSDGAMTQKAVTDALVADAISYDNSQSGLAADNVQDAVDDMIDGQYPVDLSVSSVGDGQANVRGRCWVVDSTTREHFIIKRNPNCNKLSVTANSSFKSYIVFLKSYTTPVNNVVLPVTDVPYPCVSVEVGLTKTVDIPSDCNYIIIHKQTGVSQTYTPASVTQIVGNDGISNEDKGLYNTNFAVIPTGIGWIGEFGQMVTNSGQEHYLFDLTNIVKIRINAGANTTYYTWASSTSISGWTPLIATRYEVAANTTDILTVPTGAKYLVIGKATGGNDYTPASTIFYTESGLSEVTGKKLAQGVDTPINISKCEELYGWLGEIGNLVHNYVGSAHISIPVVGKKVTITPNSNDSYYCFASAIKGYNWTLATGETRTQLSSVATIDIPSDAKYIIFGIRTKTGNTDYTPQSVVFHEEITDWVSRMNTPKPETLWRFMTYNIGHMNGGGVTAIDRRRKSSITDSDYDSKKEVALAICNQFKTDYVGVTEYPLDFAPFSTSHSTETTRDILFKRYWSSFLDLNSQDPSHIGDVNYDDYNGMFGRIPLLDLHKVEWNSELLADRFYMLGTGLLGECEVKIVLAHFGFNREDMTDTTKQDIQVAELIAAFDQEQYVIIMGDLNLPSLSVLDPFVAAGYSLANGGAFGTFNTYRNTDAFANRALDHIIVKGFNIKNVYMIDNDLSDHNPFLADLEIV